MRKSFAYHDRANFVWLVIVPLLLIAPAASTIAAELKEAHVTRIIKDVQLLPSQAAPRPAVVNDNVRSGTAVRTGADSRTELTFTDLTLARLGANTIFSFNEGTRNLDLGGGAVLLHVPKGAGGAKITTAAITAGITGTTVMMEYHRNAYIKFIVLEGTARMYLKNHLGESVLIGPGQMLIVKPNATSLPDPVTVDLKRLVQTCLLITEFAPLASQPLILQQIQIQQNNRDLIPTNLVIYGRGTLVSLVDPTNVNVISQATTAIATPTPSPTPVPTPSKFGTPSVITSPDPYVITSGTTISTDPTITTNSVTDFGKIWRGQTQDGLLSAFIFGSTSAFDTASGFDTELNGQNGSGGAVFKFTSLQLTGNPTISTPTGVINLGLIAVNGITSGGPGGTLTFTGIRGLLLATQDGSINLGSEISFSGIHDINFYARGTGSNLTLGSAIFGVTNLRLWAQGTMQINGDESASNSFRAFSGGDFLAGSGMITAQNIDIESLSNINIDSRQFPNFTGNFNVNAAGTLNATLHPGSGGTSHFNGTSLTAHGNTINLQSSVNPTTFDLGTASVSLTAGSGGIQARNVLFANGSSLLLEATGDINIYGTQNGAGSDTIIAGGAFTSQSDVSALTLQAGTAINVGGQLSALSVLAGTNITAGNVTVLDTTGTTSDGNVDISARNQISITNGVDINRKFAGASSGLNVLLSAGTDLTAGSSLMVNVNNSVSGNLNTGAIIALNAGQNLAVNGGDLSLTVANNDGHIRTGGNISVTTGGDLNTTGAQDIEVRNAEVTGGTIDTGGNISMTIGGNVNAGSLLIDVVSNGGHIGTGGNINYHVTGDINVAGDAYLFIGQGNFGSDPALDIRANNISVGGNLTAGTQVFSTTGLFDPIVSLQVNGTISVGGVLAVLGTVTAGGDMTAGTLQSVNVTTPGNIIVGSGGIRPDLVGSTLSTYTLTAARVMSQGGINFNIFETVLSLTINADSLSFGTFGDIVGPVTFNGLNASSTIRAGSGGTFTVNTSGPITVSSDIEATTGHLNSDTDPPAGAGGTVNLSSSGDTVTVNNRIEVSSDDPSPTPPPVRRSASGGNINISSGKANGVAVNISNSGQLLSLLNANAPGPGGTITVMATAPTGNTSSINVSGTVEADRGTVDIEHAGDNGQINIIGNATVLADIVKIGAFGTNGQLNIGGGLISADTLLKLYAPGSNGQLNFVSNVTLDGNSTKILAANAVTIFNNVVVTIGGTTPASVFVNNNIDGVPNANYTGFGGNGSTTGTFGGVGANQPLPLTQAPPFGPAASRNGGAANTDGNAQTLSSTNVASSGRVEGSNVKTASRKATGVAINVGSTDALLSLLDGTGPGPGGKITIPASKSTSNSRNPSRINTAGRQKADPGALDIRTASSLPARRLPQ